MTDAVIKFDFQINDTALDDLRFRLGITRFPDHVEDAGWEYGIPVEYLRELVSYWRHEYDWKAEEARINELEQFRTIIDREAIHFVHVRSPNPDAFPLLLMHGWPGAFTEFLDVIPLLRDTYDLIVPSLPGYGFSNLGWRRGWDVPRIARAFIALMARLGYSRYGAQGGDWGAQIATRIGALDPEHCVAIHLNMPIAERPAEAVELSADDHAGLAALAHFQREESGYALEQSTKPQTIGVALHDSPAAMLGWIVEKFRTWSDCDGHPENAFTRDQMLTIASIYWFTGTSASAARLYWEHRNSKEAQQYVSVPTGVARYPKEVLRFPRPWIDRRYNVTHWVDMPRGGHFAAMEQPALFADDLRNFFLNL